VAEKRASLFAPHLFLLPQNLQIVLKSGAPLGLVDLVIPHPQCSTTGAQPEHVVD
jgi:hypothetical protein